MFLRCILDIEHVTPYVAFVASTTQIAAFVLDLIAAVFRSEQPDATFFHCAACVISDKIPAFRS
jgi:hypothetical protein